ncbi:uncharacterized protein LOC141623857 [Silene latifolia]|uniref:uncharacterized protein LOC141623857 n=1 Tax=Silene latifolia TaxID=37657 RepID=UPI003D77C6EF
MDYRRFTPVVDDEAKLKDKHRALLQDYFALQKECVSKKRKLKESRERKMTLFHEIRFLKRRRNLLLKNQMKNSEQRESVKVHKTDAKYNAESSRRYMNANASTSTSGQPFQNHRPPMIPNRNPVSSGKEVAASAPLNSGKRMKNLLTNGKRAEKRKISWQDQLALKV